MAEGSRLLRGVALAALLLPSAWAAAPSLPVSGRLPAGAQVVALARVEANGPLAVDAAGRKVAYLDGGLWSRDLVSGATHTLTPDRPVHLVWSADGEALAAAFEQGGKSLIRVFDDRGRSTAETTLPGRVSGLQWRADGTLLVLTFTVERFRFGTSMEQVLHHWDRKGEPTARRLNGSTLMPKVAEQLEASLAHMLGFALSPLQDEILYYRLYNPPALTPQLRLVLYHLGSGRERILADVALAAVGAAFSGAGDRILYGNGEQETRLLDPWGDRVLARYPVAGKRVAMSPSGGLLLLDGQLFIDGRLAASFPAESRGLFAAWGRALLVQHGTHLFRVSGLPDGAPDGAIIPPMEAEASRRRELRKWLSEGLITTEDYRLQEGKP